MSFMWTFTSAPASSSSFTQSGEAKAAASISAVLPFSSRAFTSAPASSNIFTVFDEPTAAAHIRGVVLSSSRKFTSAPAFTNIRAPFDAPKAAAATSGGISSSSLTLGSIPAVQSACTISHCFCSMDLNKARRPFFPLISNADFTTPLSISCCTASSSGSLQDAREKAARSAANAMLWYFIYTVSLFVTVCNTAPKPYIYSLFYKSQCRNCYFCIFIYRHTQTGPHRRC